MRQAGPSARLACLLHLPHCSGQRLTSAPNLRAATRVLSCPTTRAHFSREDYGSRAQDLLAAHPILAVLNSAPCYQINVSLKKVSEFLLHSDVIKQASIRVILKSYHHINIALWAEIRAQHGAKYRQFANPPTPTELCDACHGKGLHHTIHLAMPHTLNTHTGSQLHTCNYTIPASAVKGFSRRAPLPCAGREPPTPVACRPPRPSGEASGDTMRPVALLRPYAYNPLRTSTGGERTWIITSARLQI